MSLRATQWALYDAPTDLDLVEFRLLMGIADNVDSQGRGFGKSVATIMEEIFHGQVSERTIRNRLGKLRERGILVPGDQRLVAYLPGNRRPIVYDLNMSGQNEAIARENGSNELAPMTENRGAHPAPLNDGPTATGEQPDEPAPNNEDVAPQPMPADTGEIENTALPEPEPEPEPEPVMLADSGDDDVIWIDETHPGLDENPTPEPAKQACNRPAAGVQQGCSRGARMFADKTIETIKNIKTRESRARAHAPRTTSISQTDYDGTTDPQAIALAERLGLADDIDRIWADFVDWQHANDRRSADWAASFRRWLRKETQYAPKTPLLTVEHGSQALGYPMGAERASQAPSRPHRHTWACEHVSQLLDRTAADAQPDQTACHLAHLLNQGIEPHDALTRLTNEPSQSRKDHA